MPTANPTTLPAGLPMPAGTTENGEPFWIVNGQKIFWAQMQQALWQQQKSGGRLEQMPAMPVFQPESIPVSEPKFEQPEAKVERAAEQKVESSAETAASQAQPYSKQVATPTPSLPTARLVGDSVNSSLNWADPRALTSFYAQHHKRKADPKKPISFLTALIGKLLRSQFVGDSKS